MREIDLEIAGQRLHIRTDEDEAYMRGLARFVDEQMREVGKGQQRGIASLTIALLAALRIADEYHKVEGHRRTSIDCGPRAAWPTPSSPASKRPRADRPARSVVRCDLQGGLRPRFPG